jgi:hypothetical protein
MTLRTVTSNTYDRLLYFLHSYDTPEAPQICLGSRIKIQDLDKNLISLSTNKMRHFTNKNKNKMTSNLVLFVY